MLRHVLPNAMLPLITVVGLNVGALISGAVIIEIVFNLPGIGTTLVLAVLQRDYPVVQGVTLLIGLLVVTINSLTDLLYLVVDPRTRGRMRLLERRMVKTVLLLNTVGVVWTRATTKASALVRSWDHRCRCPALSCRPVRKSLFDDLRLSANPFSLLR